MTIEINKQDFVNKYFNREIEIESDEYIVVDFNDYSIGCFLDQDIKYVKDMIKDDNIKLFHRD